MIYIWTTVGALALAVLAICLTGLWEWTLRRVPAECACGRIISTPDKWTCDSCLTEQWLTELRTDLGPVYVRGRRYDALSEGEH